MNTSYIVTATDQGYELRFFTGPPPEASIIVVERGGHGPIESAYAEAERAMNSKRSARPPSGTGSVQ